MRFIVSLIAVTLAALGVASTPIQSDPVKDLWRARVDFNAGLLKALDHKSNGQNVVVSPFGIHSALSAVLAGANGDTFKQLWNGLG